MKTKKILGTLALAALAAACSNEEFEAVNNSPALNGRVELGQISLTMGDADTRWTVGEGADFNNLYAEEGDEVGACLIDVYNPIKGNADQAVDAKYKYDLTNYIQTNYSFKKGSGAEWVSEAKMVEGNYVFYAPYNANHSTRQSLTVKFNPVQQLAKAADGSIDAVSTIKELKESGAIMAVSHKFIAEADGKSVSTNLLPIYAYPLVTLKNNYKEKPAGSTTAVATDVVINQVVITKTGDNFVTEGTLKFTATSGTAIAEKARSGGVLSNRSVVAKLGTFNYYAWDSSNKKYIVKEENGEKEWKNGSNANYTSDLVAPATGKVSSAIVVKAPENAWTLKAGESTKFHVVMPADDYSSATLNIQVYTNKGVFNMSGFNGTIAAGKRYAKSEYNTNGSLKQPAEAGMSEAGDTYKTIMAKAQTASENIVATTEDLVTLINNTPASKDNGTANALKIKPLNSSVQVNAAVVSAIRAKDVNGFTVKFTAAPAITADVASANKKIEFEAGAIIASGTITLGNNVKFDSGSSTNPSQLYIAGGTVTLNGATFTASNSEIVNDGGDLTVKSNFSALINKDGTVSMPNEIALKIAETAGSLVNLGGTITLGDGNKNSADAAKTFTNAISNEKGTLNVQSNTKCSGPIGTNGSYDTEERSATINNNGTIATIALNRSKGTINNWGTLTSVATNNGTIDLKSSAAEVTVSDGTTGKINNTIDAKKVDYSGTQKVYYEFTSDVTGTLTPETAVYNTIILKNMTWKPNADQLLPAGKNIELNGATISVYTENLVIGIQGTVKVTANSYMKGASSSNIYSTGACTKDSKKKLFISGVTYKYSATYSSGWTGGTALTTDN